MTASHLPPCIQHLEHASPFPTPNRLLSNAHRKPYFQFSSLLVHSCIRQALDDVGAIKQPAVAGHRATQRAAPLNHGVVTLETRLLDTAERTAAYIPTVRIRKPYGRPCSTASSTSSPCGDGVQVNENYVENLQSLPPGTQRPVAPDAAVHVSCLREVLATQQSPVGTGRLSF